LRTLERLQGIDSGFTRPWDGDEITLGFDGSSTNDATALVACRVRDRFLFPLLIEEAPDGPESEDWEVDTAKVDAAVARAFAKYKVVGFYADPPLWQDYVDAWAREFGDQLKVQASGKHSIKWYTKRDVQMAEALERLHTAIVKGGVMHDDDTRLGKVMSRHFRNARRWKRRGGTVIGKESKNSPKKIDAAVAATLAFEAAADYLAKKIETPEEQSFVPVRVR
jgi:phage terminase large subunit-like protein